jgi:cytochrome d ubiquinol oxidase subunit I
MTDLTIARTDMALTLGFHIIFAVFGMAMPLLMCIAEGLWLRTKQEAFLKLAKAWAKGTAILFAVGAVSGTVLSFELGLLWPHFMAYAGPIIGMPFSLEGFAFFLEAIFLGIYLYGWGRVRPWVHWVSGLLVLFGGTASGVFIMAANAWMNSPAGFEIQNGVIANVDPWKAMFNPAYLPEALHMLLAAFQAVGFAVAGVHAFLLLQEKGNIFHQKAIQIALPLATVLALLQPLSGDYLAHHVAVHQPAKLAAMEGQWETQRGAPLRIGGLPDEESETTPFAIEIPKLLSFLAYDHFDAEVRGLKSFPTGDRPPVAPVHIAFQVMVFCGVVMIGVGLWGLWLMFRRRLFNQINFLRSLVIISPLGILAIEAGWVVTEVGRQPWIIYGFQRTAEAVTPMPGLTFSFLVFLGIYLILSLAVITTMGRFVFSDLTLKRARP